MILPTVEELTNNLVDLCQDLVQAEKNEDYNLCVMIRDNINNYCTTVSSLATKTEEEKENFMNELVANNNFILNELRNFIK